MTGLDYIVLIIIGVAAIGGFMRGFVQEILSLCAWALALFAIHYLHTGLTIYLANYVDSTRAAALLAFALLLLIPYAGMKLIAGRLGQASRNSLLGPIDRLLGLGFGGIKGAIVAVLAFALLVLGYDDVWGVTGRPVWITDAQVYPYIDEASDMLVQLIDERDQQLETQGTHIRGGNH